MTGDTISAFGGAEIPDELARFLARVLAWSTAGPPSYVNIHAFTPKQNPKVQFRRVGGGRAYASLTEYAELQQFLFLLNRDEDEVFFCLSTRSAHKGSGRDHLKASRSKRVNQPVQLKALVLDLDVKPKGYPSQRAALAAVLPFLERLGIQPGPIVDTGGGLHVYITLSEPITPSVWQPLANALIEAAKQAGIKHDVGVTRDDDRLLRLPGSFNRKTAEPRPCRILDLGADTTLADLQAALAPYRGVVTSRPNGHTNGALLDPALFPPRRPITGGEAERVQAEVELFRVATSPELLVRACGVVADSLDRGGDGDLEPLWFELAKLCHYVEDGHALFHRLSHKYDGYSIEEADTKYNSVQTGGWPHCQTIASSSPDAMAICQTCPHWGGQRTPIHAAQNGAVPHVNGGLNGHALPAQAFAAVGTLGFTEIRPPWLPEEYIRDGNSYVWVDSALVFNRPVYSIEAVYHPEPENRLMIDFEYGKGTADTDDVGKFSISAGTLATAAKFAEATIGHGLVLNRNLPQGRNVATDILTRIQTMRAARTEQRTGWVGREFAYGGHIYTATGPRPAGAAPIQYLAPRGRLDEWQAAVDFFMGRGCIEMEIIMATGYTGPLVEMAGVPGVLLHVFSDGSGVGKTMASTVACSVASDPSAIVRDTTPNAGQERITAFNNITVYFDEMIADAIRDTRQFPQLVKNATSGSGRNRLHRTGDMRKVATSRNQVVGCSNRRLTEVSKVATTNAQAARIVEIEMSDALKKAGIEPPELTPIGQTLEKNYGVAMPVYIDFVVRNYDAVNDMMQSTMRWLNHRLKSGHSERFWIAQLTIILVAVRIARKLGLQRFDVDAIQKFLLDWYAHHREAVFGSEADTHNPEYQLAQLYAFYNDNLDKRLTTDYLPRRGAAKDRVREELFGQIIRPRELAIRVATKDCKMFVSEPKLENWHKLRGTTFQAQKATLIRAGYCMHHRKGKTIGGSTNFTTMPEHILEFDLNDPRLADFLPDEV